MSEKGKKRPAWLTGIGEDDQTPPPHPRRNQAPLGETAAENQETGEINGPSATEYRVNRAQQTTTSTVTQPPHTAYDEDVEADSDQTRVHANSQPPGLGARLRKRPILTALFLIILAVIFYVSFWGGLYGEIFTANQEQRTPAGAESAPKAQDVDDTGIVFEDLYESGDETALQGAGLDWEGSITPKDDDAGEAVTLEGPTIAQIERGGFEVDNSDIDSGVYALAQDDGSVLHVAIHTYQLVKEQQDEEADEEVEREITLGTIFELKDGGLRQSGFYVDKYVPNSSTILRTYYPGLGSDKESSYEVSFSAPKGTPVPLLVGYRNQGQEKSDEQ